MASLRVSRPGRSSLGRQCWGGPAISRGNMDLRLYHQICLHVSLNAQLHLSSSRALMWPPDRCWVEGQGSSVSIFWPLKSGGAYSEHVAEEMARANGCCSFFPN